MPPVETSWGRSNRWGNAPILSHVFKPRSAVRRSTRGGADSAAWHRWQCHRDRYRQYKHNVEATCLCDDDIRTLDAQCFFRHGRSWERSDCGYRRRYATLHCNDNGHNTDRERICCQWGPAHHQHSVCRGPRRDFHQGLRGGYRNRGSHGCAIVVELVFVADRRHDSGVSDNNSPN